MKLELLFILVLALFALNILAAPDTPKDDQTLYLFMKSAIYKNLREHCQTHQDGWTQEVCQMVLPVLENLDGKTLNFLRTFKQSCSHHDKCVLPLRNVSDFKLTEMSRTVWQMLPVGAHKAFLELASGFMKNDARYGTTRRRIWKRARPGPSDRTVHPSTSSTFTDASSSSSSSVQEPVSLRVFEELARSISRQASNELNPELHPHSPPPEILVVFNPGNDGDVTIAVSESYTERSQAAMTTMTTPPVQQQMTMRSNDEDEDELDEDYGLCIECKRAARAYANFCDSRGCPPSVAMISAWIVFITISAGSAAAMVTPYFLHNTYASQELLIGGGIVGIALVELCCLSTFSVCSSEIWHQTGVVRRQRERRERRERAERARSLSLGSVSVPGTGRVPAIELPNVRIV